MVFFSTGRFGRFGRFWNLKKWVTLKSKLLFQKRPKRPKRPEQTPFFKSVLGKPPGEAFEKSVLSLLFQILKCPEFAFLKSYRPGTLFWDLKVSQPWEVFFPRTGMFLRFISKSEKWSLGCFFEILKMPQPITELALSFIWVFWDLENSMLMWYFSQSSFYYASIPHIFLTICLNKKLCFQNWLVVQSIEW